MRYEGIESRKWFSRNCIHDYWPEDYITSYHSASFFFQSKISHIYCLLGNHGAEGSHCHVLYFKRNPSAIALGLSSCSTLQGPQQCPAVEGHTNNPNHPRIRWNVWWFTVIHICNILISPFRLSFQKSSPVILLFDWSKIILKWITLYLLYLAHKV